MNATKTLHIFRPGRQTAMNGLTLEFSESDLAASAAAYDPAKHEAPIVIGHPKHDAPAYGWVKSLAAAEDGLQAEPHQVDAAFADLVEAGRYKKISASFYLPDAPNNPVPGVYYLRHVGFLGAQPPAVKGLKAAEFADAEDGVVEFGDWDDRTNAGLWRGMRDWLIAKFGLEEADKALPAWNVQTLADSAAQPEAPAETSETTAFADPPTHKENPVTPEQAAALEAENAKLKQQLAASEADKAAKAKTKRHDDNVAYAEQLIGDGKLAPKHKDAVVAFLDFSEADTSLEFGEGDAKQPLATAFKSFLGELPKVVDFGEHATKGKAAGADALAAASAEFAEKSTDPDRLSLHVRATQLASDKGIPYESAVRQLIA